MRLNPRHLLPAVIATGSLLVPTVLTAPSAGALPQTSGSSKGAATASASTKSSAGSSTTKSGTTKSSTSSKGAESSGAAAGKVTHIVRSGDTVVGIAKKYGVSADSVRAANGIVDDELYLGARLIIDAGAGGAKSTTAASTKGGSTKGGSYTVKEGDYLDGIARKHGVSLSALLKANGMKASSLILPGDTLKIPGSSSTTSAAASQSGSKPAGDVGPDLRCPVPGASFMNDWGFPRDDGGRFHEGTDLFAPKGTTIVAPASGSVVFGKNGLGGTTFTLTTSTGWVIYGAHMSATIGSSRTVKAGEAIGRVGNTGNAAGGDTHLHMGLKRAGGTAMNPYPSLHDACG
jgi:murein DD-endopeptidase MepM/ murein hydrolase activator NlpD